MSLDHITLAATSAILLIAVYTDIRYGKIFNAVTVPFAALGIVLNVVDKGLYGVWFSVQGIGLGLALFFFSSLFGRILGAGDCKLFAALGALQGPVFLVWAILYSLLAGGVLAILFALFKGRLLNSLKRLWQAIYMRFILKMPMEIDDSPEQVRMPYALAILVGAAIVIYQVILIGVVL